MGKNKGGSTTTKKGPDLIHQKIQKAKRSLQSGGKRGLDAFLARNTELRQNKTIQGLIAKAATLKVRPPKGKRGSASYSKNEG